MTRVALISVLALLPLLAFNNCGAFRATDETVSLQSLASLDENLDLPLIAEGATLQIIAQGLGFTEGPSYLNGELVFSDQQANRLYKYNWASGVVSVFLDPADRLNGTAYDVTNGRLLAARGGSGRNVVAIAADGAQTVLASRYQGQRFNGPNDLVPLTSPGGFYLTDPIYGAITGGAELGFRGVFYVSNLGEVSLVDSTLQNPNGIALSPAENVLYVADDGDKKVYAYDVAADGKTSNKRLFFSVPNSPGGSSGNDGMAMDSQGNLYVTCLNKIWIVNPEGTLIDSISIAGSLTNVAFGGPDMKTLFITVGPQVYRLQMNVRGLR